MTHHYRLTCTLLVTLLVSACHDDNTKGGGEANRCERVSTQLERACSRDGHCPCASYCDLGRCVSDCNNDAACGAGEICNDFGRCAVKGANPVVLTDSAGQGNLVLAQKYFQQNSSGEYLLTLSAVGGPIDRVRIAPGDAMEVAHSETGTANADLTYSKEIVLQDLAANTSTTVVLRKRVIDVAGALSLASPDATQNVEVFVSNGQATQATIGTVTTESAIEVSTIGAPTTAAGEYAGFVRLSRAGVNRMLVGKSPTTRTSAQIRAKVYLLSGNLARLEIIDPNGLIHPSGSWVGDIDLSTLEVSMPPYTYIQAASALGSSLHIVAAPNVTLLQQDPLHTDWDGTLSFALTLLLEGSASNPLGQPFVVMDVFLEKANNLDIALAPPRSPAQSVAYNPAAASRTAFAWEQAYQNAFAAFTTPPSPARLMQTWSSHNPTPDMAFAHQRPAYLFHNLLLSHAMTPATPSTASITLQNDESIVRSWAELKAEVGSGIMGASMQSWLGGFSFYDGDADSFPFRLSFFQEATEDDDWIWLPGDFPPNLPPPSNYPPSVLQLDGRTSNPVVPCAFEDVETAKIMPLRYDSSGVTEEVFSYTANGTAVDFCAELAAHWSCDPVDLQTVPEAARTFSISVDHGLFLNPRIMLMSLSVPVRASQGCEMRPIAPNTVATILCDNQQGNLVEADALAPSSFNTTSGDMQCAATGKSLVQGFDTPSLIAKTLVDACAHDLDAFAASNTAAFVSDHPTTRLNEAGWNTPSACINPMRFLTILGAASEELRYRADTGHAPNSTVPDVVFMRLLQKFFDAHTLVASESVQKTGLFSGVENGHQTQALVEGIERANDAWRLLLHPRVARALLEVRREVLHDTNIYDSLVSLPIAMAPAWSTDRGLLPSIVALSEAQSVLLQSLTQRAYNGGARLLPVEVAEAIRFQTIVGAFVDELEAHATDPVDNSLPAWHARLQDAHRRADAARAQTMSFAAAVAAGSNPLGIEDVDLPLYFNQITTGADSRFTAVSDYLLGKDFSTFAPVAAMVEDAVEAFQLARAAYLVEEQRLVNVVNAQADTELFVYTERVELGAAVLDLCGQEAFPGMSADQLAIGIETGNVNVRGCYYNAQNAACVPPAPQLDDTAQALKDNKDAVYRQLCKANADLAPTTIPFSFTFSEASQDDVRRLVPTLGQGATVYAYGPPLLRDFYNTVATTFSGVPSYQYARRTPRIIYDHGTQGVAGAGDILLMTDGRIMQATIGGFPSNQLGFVQPLVGIDGEGALVRPLKTNMCNNPDAPGFPGFLPVVSFPNDDPNAAPLLRCPPASGFGGTVQPVTYDADKMRAQYTTESSLDLVRHRINYQQFCDTIFPPAGVGNALSEPQPPSVCYRGTLGQESFALRSLAVDIAVANEEAASLIREYDLQMRSCTILRAANHDRENLEASHNTTMNELQDTKTALEITAAIADRTADCADSIGAAQGVRGGIAAGVSCGARALAAGAESAAIGIEFSMDKAQRSHDLATLNIENDAEEDRCFAEAEIALVGLEAARLRIQRATDELSLGYLKFEQAVESLDLLVERGKGAIAAAQSSTASVVGRDPWYNDDVNTFRRKFALARRAAYIGVRAVEYEFQQSLSARGAVLVAEKPDDLVQVLEDLRSFTVTGSINGAQPAKLTEVLSLRKELLQIANQQNVDAGSQVLSDVERFRQVLASPRYHVIQDGVLTGVEIPFHIAPLRELNRGNFAGVPIVADNSCGERLVSVNATIVGDTAKMFSGLVQKVDVEIRQRNTFYANKCANDALEPFQVASTRPHRNLFRLPGVGVGAALFTLPNASNFAKARVQARLNVDPIQLASSSFEDGASTELAARLLFGEYSLFIPATQLPLLTGGVATGDGLRLNEVDDILLKVDYLSVAR